MKRWALPAILAAGIAMAVLLGRAGANARFVFYPDDELARVRDVHAYKGRPVCQACHAGRSRALSAEAIELCRRCHPGSGREHPVGIFQHAATGLPLLADGRIACHTCHDPHDVRRQPAGLRLAFSDLCLECHRDHHY